MNSSVPHMETSDFHAAETRCASADLLSIVHDTSNQMLARWIEDALDNPAILERVARHSHRHQLGFFKYVLRNDNAGACLRLHVWDAPGAVAEDIHSHRLGFVSRVVLGSMTENTYTLVSGSSHARFRYSTDALGKSCTSSADGRAAVELLSSRQLSAGDIYVRDAQGLHTITNVEPGTVTLSLWDGEQSDAVVLKEGHALASDCLVAIGTPIADVREGLAALLARINA